MISLTFDDLTRLTAAGDPMIMSLCVDAASPGSVAQTLGISRQRVHELIKAGQLMAVRVNYPNGELGAILIPQKSLDAYLSRRASAKAA